MVALNQVVADGAHLVARAVEYQIRQATSTVLSSSGSATPSPSPTSGSSISSTTSPTASPDPSAGNSNNNDQNNGGQSSTSSPLLFFVALGFGVVFTNLWIIVGVKYCFRYNARNRQLRGLDENGEPINLENMPARPHRRRREKKLMTMDEVNEKFPMMKYKAWVSARAREGLPTAGGVSAPASRANSVMSVEGVVPEIPSKEPSHTEEHPDSAAIPEPVGHEKPNTSPGIQDNASDDNVAAENTLTQSKTAESTITKDHDRRASVDEDDEDEHIDAALPPELVGTQGDTCAICIDTLEDDDDIRGLTCGHAFHAVCIDPWLTNRRASCPLCKADYYTPKPRPPPADGDPTSPTSPNVDPTRNNGRMSLPRTPQRTFTSWSNFRGGPRGMIPGRFGGVGTESSNYSRPPRIWERNRADRRRHPEPQPAASDNAGLFTRVRSRLPPFRLNELMRRERNGQTAEADDVTASGANGAANTTPSQLEAGVRPSGTTAN
ncbi:uncharacterized protein F4807DRAFT_285236 [Annulohypoxylon truncatum]|uniref:uncharacterized protein n=1 Tax=Annulohypoxylon truncatum TaxID=327061 RepID=UPI002007B99B|nr:uncharacterized protein F4807DRAFT_285236 [Annulohypoxylon truncatum]KAI1205443.1 hypothetical protein F4807DRAFT_285236 [Annulohypoxylon truncatum]